MELHNSEPNAFGEQESLELQDAGASAAPTARGASQILVADANGTVVLPAGTELGSIRVEGRDLVVIGADGVRYVIPDGAIIVPQIVIDDVAIPPLNLAALLIGNEPQPAAGNAQSSGGNFSRAVGPLQAAFELGDLLPYTELAFPEPEEREIIPQIPDREPDVVVITPDQPAGATSATSSVNEAGLPARGAEPAGSNSASNSETTAGTIVFNAPDGLSAIAINGTVITAVGQTVTTAIGTLTVTSIAPGTIGYSYTLADNTIGAVSPDNFAITVTDTDGDVARATLAISVIDDAPTARPDTDSVAAGTYGPETGNVMTGTGTTSGAPGADTQGADGARVTSIAGTGGTDTTFDSAGNLVVAGRYGTLTIKADGSYSYVRAPNTAGGVTDQFTYVITDGDGDTSTSTLTINIGDSPASVISLPTSGAGTVVNEAGLPDRPSEAPGTAAPTNVETTAGTITVVAPDGIATVQIGGVTVTGPGQVISTPQGSLTITGYNPATGTITYSFTLADNTAGDSTTVSFPITVTDVDGDSDTKTLTITILDDAPTAVNDAATQSAEGVPVTVNVLANDIQGADSVQPNTVALVAGTLSGTGTLVNNGNGTFTYTPGAGETGTVTFDYTITDGDGDTSRATVTLTMAPDSVPTISVAGDDTVDEAALPARGSEPAGSNAASTDETAAGTITITTGGDTVGSLVINGVNVSAGGTVTTAKGVLTVTLSGGAYSYSYTLTDNTLADPDSDTFTLKVTDSDGDPASTTLVIAIADDVPTAADDAGAVPTGTYGPIGGNIVTNDTPGADGIVVTTYTGVTTGAAGSTIDGTYGKLSIAADGTYSYTRNPGTPGGVTDSFTYTVRDGDGDTSTANLVITIGDGKTTLDLPLAGTPGSTQVLEEGLPAGSNAAGNGEFASGTFSFTAPDGPAKVTIDGTPITAIGQTVAGTYGTLTITSIAAGSIGYTYELTTNTVGDSTFDDFAVVIADQDDDSTSGTLRIDIVDDIPTATDDVDSVKEDGPLTATGNVITGADGTFPPDANATDGVADVKGADGATVTAIEFNPAGGGAAVAGAVAGPTAGTYGTLTLNADGSYSYALDNANPLVQGLDKNETLTETFTYTLTDGDTDADTATLTITINGTDDGVTITGLNLVGGEETVFENDLTDGSSPAAANLAQTGSFTVTALDGIQTITVGGTTVFSGGGTIVLGSTFNAAFGTLTITSVTPTTTDANGDVTAASIGYSYTLNDNTLTHTGANGGQLTDSFAVTVTDTDGSIANDSLDVVVVDDVPTANPDGIFSVAEATPFVIDALSNDTKGADGVDLATGVAVATNPTKGTVTYNGDGTFTYTPNAGAEGPDSFTYTITDNDGDPSTTTVTLDLLKDSVPVVKSTTPLVVDEDGLPGANVDSVPLQTNPGEFDGTESVTATGTAVVNFGADVPANLLGSIVLLDNAAYDTQLQTLDGNPVTFAVEGGVLIGRSTGGTEVLRVTVTGAALGPTTGDVTYTYTALLSQPVKHAVTGTEDLDTLGGILFQVTDSETDTAIGSFSVSVRDDVPSAETLAGATFAESSGAHDVGDAVTLLGIVPGADGLQGTVQGIVFTNGGATGGTLSINGAGRLIYTSPTNVTSGTTVTETFTYTVTDRDGDSVTRTVTFGVSDTGITNPTATNASVDEDNIGVSGNAGGPGDLTTPVPTGTISYTKGADAITGITLSTGALGFTKLDGTAITTSYDAATGMLTGYGTGPADVVFTVTLGALGQASTGYTVTLLQPVKHTVDGTEDDKSFTVNAVISDADNSTANTSFSVLIDDDTPVAGNLTGATFAESSGAHDIGDAAGLLGISAGADGLQGTVQGIVFTNGGATGGTLSINGAGRLIYTSPTNVTSGTTVTETFTYTVIDRDGDSVTRTVTFGVSDTGITNPAATNATIDEDNIGVTGNAGGPGDLTTPVPTGTISYTKGADAITGITLSTGALGFTKLDGTAITTSYDAATGVLTGYGTGPADVVFTVTLGALGQASTGYTVTLLQPVKHTVTDDPSTGAVETAFEDDKSFTVNAVITDADGSTANTSFSVLIDDDTPVASAVSATQATENAAFDIAIAGSFNPGADGLGSITFTQPTQGTVVLNGTTFTYTPAAGAGSASTSDSFTYTVIDKDGDRVTQTVSVTLQPDSTPTVKTTTNLAVDEDGFPTANVDAVPLQATPSETDGGENLTDTSGSMVVDFKNDVPVTLAGSAVLVDSPALDGQLQTLAGVNVVFAIEAGGALVGRAAGVEVIRITPLVATAGPGAGEVTYTYSTILSQPVKHATAGTEDFVTLTGVSIEATDRDGDKVTGSFNVTIRDDVPTLDVTAGNDAGVTLVTQDAETDGVPTATDTATSSAAFGGVFGFTLQKGADGGTDPVLSYALDVTNSVSGLTSNGVAINLYKLADGTIVGSTAGTNPGAINGTAVFSVSVSSTGVVTLSQYQQIDHAVEASPIPGTDAPFDDQFAKLADGLVTLTATATFTDRDGDASTDSATVNIGENFRFADDGPILTNVSSGVGVTIDETAAGANFAAGPISATSASAVITATSAFGADGPAATGATTYGLLVQGGGVTGLKTAIGDFAVTLVQTSATVLTGQYNDGTTKTAFTLSIGTDGKVTVTQNVALEHNQDGNTAGDYDDALNLLGFVAATITIKDFDGDTATATQAIGAQIVFKDDGPDATNDTDSVAAGTTGPANGNVITGVYSGVADANPTDGNVDYVGADGARVTSVTSSQGTFAVAAAGNTVLQGSFGTLTISADGNYTYARTPGAGGGQNDVFTYTLTDNDGDFDAATLTISIGDAAPVAGSAAATVDDDGLSGNPGGSGDIDANNPPARTADAGPNTSEAIFQGTLGGTAGDGTSTFFFQNTLTGTFATVGTERVVYSVSGGAIAGGGTTLTATVAATDGGGTPQARAGTTLFTIAINDTSTGAYTLTLLDNVLHNANILTENTDTLNVAYQIRDADGDLSAVPGNLSVWFNDDSPVLVGGHTDIVLSGTDLDGSGIFDYSIGADGRTSFSALNSDLAIALSGSVGATAIVNPLVTWVSESANAAEFDFTFKYDSNPTNANNPLSDGSGTLTFDKVAGTYSIVLDAPIQSYTTSQTSNTFNRVDYNLTGPASQSEYVVSQLGATNPIFVRFKGIEASSSFGAGDTTFNSGNTFQGAESYVTISGASNGVSGDTIQGQGGEVLNVDLFSSDPGVPNQTNGYNAAPTASATGITLRLDLVGNDTDFVVILKLANPANPSVIVETRAIVVDPADIYKSGDAIPSGYTLSSPLDSNDGFVIIESNDYNTGLENFVIVGFQLVASTQGTSGTGINLVRGTGAGGASTQADTFADHNDNDVIKITDIGLVRNVTSTEVLHLDFDVTVTDADGDATAVTRLSVNPVTPPIALDLDGDGVEFVSGASFDYAGDGTPDATAWVGSDDGILVYDANGDGKANDGSEIVFGGGGLSDLEGLAKSFDGNRDGSLDAQDADFAKFGVWQDANGNGVSEAGEYQTLGQLGIASIGLESDGKSYTAADGDVLVWGSTTYTKTNGSTGIVADAAFATEARTAQRTAEIVSTAALATAFGMATAVAAQPADGVSHSRKQLAVEAEQVQVDAPAESQGRMSDVRSDVAEQKAQSSEEGDHASARIVGETSEARLVEFAASNDGRDASPDYLATHDAGPAHASGSMFAGMGSDGLMQALLSIGPQVAVEGQSGAAFAAVENALSDFAGEAMVDAIVGHFTDGGDSAFAFAAANDGALMLSQDLGGNAGGLHFAMMPDANDEASMLAAAQA